MLLGSHSLVRVYFDTQHLYYLPQYLPVAEKLTNAGVECIFVLYPEEGFDELKRSELDKAGMAYHFLDSPKNAHLFYQQNKADWIFFGNPPQFCKSEKAKIKARLALVLHGIGPKAIYYTASEFPFDVRFVEGQQRLQRLQEKFPESGFVDTGYAKLAPLFDGTPASIGLREFGLSPNKPTVLYAPTFYPSSIEKFDESLPQLLADYNVLIKPHYFSLTKERYEGQRALFKKWATHANVHIAGVEDYNLIPFMQISDVMLSDASSAIFEYAALNKPVVWCDFYQTRWSYRGILKFRLEKRLDPDLQMFHDLCTRATLPKQVPAAIESALNNPEKLEPQRLQITQDMVGATDGQCSERIKDYILANS